MMVDRAGPAGVRGDSRGELQGGLAADNAAGEAREEGAGGESECEPGCFLEPILGALEPGGERVLQPEPV